MPQTLEQQEKSLRWFMRNRWLYTCIWLLPIATSVHGMYRERWEWPFILRLSLPPGVSIWNSILEDAFTGTVISLFLISEWVRIHNYRRDLFLAEQSALQKAAKPPEGSWPPPPL